MDLEAAEGLDRFAHERARVVAVAEIGLRERRPSVARPLERSSCLVEGTGVSCADAYRRALPPKDGD
jgi:hypothetical protein